MSDTYLIAAYAIGLALLLGYPCLLWMTARALTNRERGRT